MTLLNFSILCLPGSNWFNLLFTTFIYRALLYNSIVYEKSPNLKVHSCENDFAQFEHQEEITLLNPPMWITGRYY